MSMDREQLRAHCLAKLSVAEEFPFGPGAAVFKVKGKMFALLTVNEDPPSISLKCDPTLAEILRETYPAVTPGYHLNKRLWNSVRVDGSISDIELIEMIDHSFAQVVKGMPKRDQSGLL